MRPPIIDRLLKMTTHIPEDYSRLRYAVTIEEYNDIKKYMYELDDIFYKRIANIPLVIEDDAENSTLVMELK